MKIMHTAHRHTNHSHTNTNTNTNTWEQVMFGRAARGAGDCQPNSKRIKQGVANLNKRKKVHIKQFEHFDQFEHYEDQLDFDLEVYFPL